MKTTELEDNNKNHSHLHKQHSGQLKRNKQLPPISRSRQNSPCNINDSSHDHKKPQNSEIRQFIETVKRQRKFVVDQYDQKAIILCQFCGGQSCPQQDYLTNKIQPNAIEGLHSNWITQQILATQRPSNKLIQKFHLLQEFKKYNINTILNLQQPGEHPYCGHGIDLQVGFSYDPQLFFNANPPIRFQNEFWEDMTSTTFQQMMKIMNIFHKSITKNGGKIAVHCHAGRGRTLMAICAWLIYHDRMTANQTIDLAILKRQGVLTKNSQRQFLRDFQSSCQKRWKNYFHEISNESLKTFSQFVVWQNVSLLRHQVHKNHQAPFLHRTILNILRNRMAKQSKQILFSFIDLNNQIFEGKKWGKQHQHRLTFLKTYLDKKKPDKIDQNEEIRVLVTLLEDFYDNLPFTPISLHAIDHLKQEVILEQSIIKKQVKQREIKKQTFKGKILNRWQDLVSKRPGVRLYKTHQQQNQQFPLNQITNAQSQQYKINSKPPLQQTLQDQQQQEPIDFKRQDALDNSGQNNFLKVESKENFFKNSNSSAFGKSGQSYYSQIQINSFWLNVLTQPAVVHEVGLQSLCTFLDFIKFAKDLLNIYKQNNSDEKSFEMLKKCLLAKLSIILQSKKRYFPALFRGPNHRDSILLKKIEKLQKYSNKNIQYLANTFMHNIIQDLPDDQQYFKGLIFKLQKVDANVEYYAKSHANSGGKFFSAQEAKLVYDKSRI